MIDLLVRDVRVRDEETGELSAVDLYVDGGRIVGATPVVDDPVEAREVIAGGGAWATPPYVEPHVHLDAALTAGQPPARRQARIARRV